ncbi:ABC transporter permease subunit [Colwellia sp. D2M02]|uniref:ABC transporter permease subunit n=1 Tax=Colwellia sp. D2M02 TaxID=2841562 RepID=UPI001C088E96|nr:ABC transporter permease subunit [Colwellia sp. D2M02]
MAKVSKSNRSRELKNSVAKWLVTVGGISVLFTLVLIFLYLLYVIKPIFESATVEPVTQIALTTKTETLSVGVDELKEVAYQISQSGNINFYHLKTSDEQAKNQYQSGDIALSQPLVEQGDILSQVISFGLDNKLLLTKQGKIQLIKPSFQAQYTDNSREIVPRVSYPLGESSLVIDEQDETISVLDFAMSDEKMVFVAFTQDSRLIYTSFIAEDDFSYSDSDYETNFIEISDEFTDVDEVYISPDLNLAFVRSHSTVFVYDLDDDSASLRATINPEFSQANTYLTTMALLSGGSSLLLGDNQGQVSQWFEVATDNGRQFKQVRTFKSQTNATQGEPAIRAIYPEQFRKSFYTLNEQGELNIFYTTSDAHLWQGTLVEENMQALAIAPRADGLVVMSESLNTDSVKQTLHVFSVHNEHPEVTWHALWQEVWYEGYAEPDYIWQSTSGSDDFEAKFSLVPISFGTIKAALYAMLFAVPIALTAAIYTAYFMTPGLRKKVKPTIEMMEALPTVILGFLAGLWLAPLMEAYLPAVFLLFIFLPLSTLITAFVWHNLPRDLKTKVPETLAPLILIPVIILAAYAAFALSPVLELVFFGGDMRQYITNDLGIDFDQRNALVVGIAMGFAVIPTIFSMAEDAIFSVPTHLTSGSLALGATQWQTLAKVVLLTASPGIFSAVMMGLGRAVGETMIVLMATGNTPILDWSIFQGMRTLAANIAVEMPESEVGSSHYRILFLAAFVLFVFTFIFNTIAEFVRQRLREKYSSM